MTWKELKKSLPDAKKAEWHQHKNGGGWVQNTAAVDDSAYVGPRAIISGDARVYGSAWVSRGRYLSSPLYIQGSSYPVTHNGGEWVYIGCELHTISEWRGKIGRDLAAGEEFTPAQISEYRDYLNLIARRVRKGA